MKRLYIEPTSACNLHCSMCFRNNWIDEDYGMMSDEIFAQILKGIDAMPSVKSVMLAGMGEPLLHKDIISMVRQLAKRHVQVELLTNGTMLSDELSQNLVEAGLSRLWVSIDGFQRETYEKIQIGSRFDLIINNIGFFAKIRKNCRMGLTFVMSGDNLKELPEINAFADRYGFDLMNFSHVIPCDPLKTKDCIYDCGYPVGKMQRFDPASRQQRPLDLCPFIEEGTCFVKWNGDICPCMQLLHSSYTYLYEEKRKVFGKSFGNLSQSSLQEIWNVQEYALFRERVSSFEYPDCTMCDGCDDRLKNERDCMYNEHPTCGACLWAQGVGRCP